MKYSSFQSAWDALALVQKPKNDGHPYTVYVNRSIGKILAVIAYSLGLTPNQLTLISFVLTFFGFSFLAVEGHKSMPGSICGVLILLLGFAFDSADGQLARLMNIKSAAGEWLDHTVDSLKIPLCHLTFVFIIYRTTPDLNNLIFFFMMMFSVVASAKFFSTEMKKKISLQNARSVPVLGTLKRILLAPFDYGVLCFLFLLAPLGFLYQMYLVWGGTFVFFCIMSFFRSFNQLNVE